MATFINPIPIAQGAANQRGEFVIINLCGGGVFRFEFFPSPEPGIVDSRRANWEEQNTTTGTKPLFYFNKDPRRIEVPEVWLDTSDRNVSLTPQKKALLALQEESCEGTPPPLLVVWGDQQFRCVLEEVHFEEKFHYRSGIPIRVRCSLNFKELQEGNER